MLSLPHGTFFSNLLVINACVNIFWTGVGVSMKWSVRLAVNNFVICFVSFGVKMSIDQSNAHFRTKAQEFVTITSTLL